MVKFGYRLFLIIKFRFIQIQPRPDRPGDMYENVDDGEKSIGPSTGFTIQNGVSIQGPNDAGDDNIDEGGFILTCGGHVTPPVDVLRVNGSPPLYHFHKAPDCLDEFVTNDKPYIDGGTSNKHGKLFGYAIDGFGIYTYSDIGGASPLLDECGGHFGYIDDNSENVTYHYHSTTYTPYNIACQGPALGKCNETQHGANFCGPGCGNDICVQPGTSYNDIEKYTSIFNDTWLEYYTVNI